MKRFSILILIILMLVSASLSDSYAQPKRLQFKYLTPDNGLSSSIASCIIQDNKGLMWIGTADGLNRYDGFNFVIYRNIREDSLSLIDNVIRDLFEDHNKSLFIGTENGLCMYDREKDKFLNYFYDKQSPLKGLSCTVSSIIEDTEGNLWLGTSVGLVYFDRQNNRITQYTHSENPGSISDDNVQHLLIDKRGNFWVATRRGLNLFKKESATFIHLSKADTGNDILSGSFITIAGDQDGNVWFGGTDGLYCMKSGQEPETGVLTHYSHVPGDNNSLSINLVRSLFVDKSDNVWIGTDNGGLNLFNKEKQNFWHYRKDDYDPRSLNNEAIESIYQDKTGNLWFGTYTGGINIAVNNREAFIKYENLPGAPLSLSHNTVKCFFETREGQIWLGTDGGGLNLFDRKTERFRRFNLDNSNLSSNAILCIHQDSTGDLWLGTWEGGLVRFNARSETFSSMTTRNSSISDNDIFAIEEGYNNDLWLGTFEHGLIHYLIKEKKFIDYNPQNSGIGNVMIVKICKFSGGRFLLGTTGNFQIFSPDENQFITYSSDPHNLNSLSFSRVTDLVAVNDTCIWIGTPNGLNRLNPVTGTILRYYKKDGLPDNFIKGLISDKQGVLWVTTSNGLCRFDYLNKKFKNFTKDDGLQGNEFSERSALKTSDGKLLIGGTKGFNIVSPEKISENKIIPDILITDLKIFNKSINPVIPGSPLSLNITETESLTLTHDLSVITFNFAVMDFSAPEKNQYAYKLENFDRDWNYNGNKGEVTYTNLNPGKYVLRVKGSNNDGVWNETGTSIRITILPPWWNTWWFRLIMIAFVILVFVLILYARVRQLERQKIQLEKTVTEKTQALKELNASKDKFFSIIAHDLKHPFLTIIGFSEVLQEECRSDSQSRIREFADMIHTSAVQTLRLLENLLEWANSQSGVISFTPKSLDLNAILKEEFLTLYDIAARKEIKLNSSVPEGLLIFADKNMIRTILRNLVSNAIKFTPRNGNVEVKAYTHNKTVEITVSDNGIGMKKEVMEKLFRIDVNLSTKGTENESGTGLGLFLCKEFIEKHGGKISVESESGKGSRFKLIFPLV